MKSDSEILADISKGGSIDVYVSAFISNWSTANQCSNIWPELLERLLIRLENIAFENFPKPTAAELSAFHNAAAQQPSQFVEVPTEINTVIDAPFSQASTQPCIEEPSQEQQQPVATTYVTERPTLQLSSPSSSRLTEVATPPPEPVEDAELHIYDQQVLTELRETMLTSFSAAPPHTVQRFAELLLAPNTHYHSLPKYLRALQRVLSVSSPTTAFPLKQPDLVNGGANGGMAFGLGSDESLGGALLTPIPWLREDSGGEEHALSPVPAQGELLRMERELGVAPAGQIQNGEREAVKEVPKLGAEDVGPQPAGTVFPDPPRTEEEAMGERREEYMFHAQHKSEGGTEMD
ncbi:hypothetical protein FN846DRAFT_160597 [Sphaerosporella brunnea]|uniref:PPP4R2-domain-containing protein n=1 Tax=Sphaerosporella brunnea TaxID=1250544 RepID=A0A5J5F8R4_9PEZI|nr:hypothetical protein FN846DRAFT_160597 [Sphaerosporella brunnea]